MAQPTQLKSSQPTGRDIRIYPLRTPMTYAYRGYNIAVFRSIAIFYYNIIVPNYHGKVYLTVFLLCLLQTFGQYKNAEQSNATVRFPHMRHTGLERRESQLHRQREHYSEFPY